MIVVVWIVVVVTGELTCMWCQWQRVLERRRPEVDPVAVRLNREPASPTSDAGTVSLWQREDADRRVPSYGRWQVLHAADIHGRLADRQRQNYQQRETPATSSISGQCRLHLLSLRLVRRLQTTNIDARRRRHLSGFAGEYLAVRQSSPVVHNLKRVASAGQPLPSIRPAMFTWSTKTSRTATVSSLVPQNWSTPATVVQGLWDNSYSSIL